MILEKWEEFSKHSSKVTDQNGKYLQILTHTIIIMLVKNTITLKGKK